MPTLLHLREKAIVYAMRCLLETLKLLFKNRVASLCTFRATLCIFYLHKTVRYDISKSTALRDIQSLEEIGVPIYSELGRNGSYKIIENSVLSPIYFSVDEMYALYFSILTLNGYKTKPFNIESIALENKFKHVLPDNVSKNISIMERTLSFEVTNHSNFSPFLKEILQGFLLSEFII